jgi:hypothetical protein
MPTPFESAQLILKLFELRRDPVLREARQWFLADFNPVTYEEAAATIGGPRNSSFRMVIGYWDMAASFVSHGAIDVDMFRAANNEIVATFAKIQPFLPQLRAARSNPNFCINMETLVMGVPGAAELLELRRKQFRNAAEARAAREGAERQPTS